MAGSDNRDHRDTGTEETREAVLADVRAHCKLLKDAGFDGDAYDIRVLVERLDAAWKREFESVTKRNGLPVAFRETQSAARNAACVCKTAHNVAKLLEALSAAGRAARKIQNVTEEADTAEVAISIAEICERALLFLSIPPRNCDRFATAHEAIEAHKQAEKNCPPKNCPECPYGIAHNKGVYCRDAWLFAPAEQEGGT